MRPDNGDASMTIRMKHWRWVTFALSAAISLAATRFFFLSPAQASGGEFGRHLARHGLAFYAHAGGGAVALLAGAVQWVLTTGSRRSRWHWLIGRTYVIGIAVGGLAGLLIAPRAFGGFVARAGFTALAVCWLASTAVAFAHARARAWSRHRAWMIRSFALTFAAVTLRIWLPLLTTAGLGFEVAYRLVAWGCWVPNLLLAEWLVARDRREAVPLSSRRRAVGPAMSRT